MRRIFVGCVSGILNEGHRRPFVSLLWSEQMKRKCLFCSLQSEQISFQCLLNLIRYYFWPRTNL